MSEEALDNPAIDSGPSSEPQEPVDSNSIIDTPAPDNAPPQSWPDSWRQDMAGDNEKHLKQLERLNSPLDLGKSFFEAQKKISSHKPALERPGSDATEDQVKAYRESIGIPESYSEYNLDFDDGTVIGDDIRPQIDGFLEYAHNSNMSPEDVKSNVGWFLKDVERAQEEMKVANDEARINGSAELRSEWGGEFQGNMNSVQSLFVEAPEGVQDALLNSAGPDGLKFANNPDNIRWLVGLAKQLNPTSTLVPPGPDQEGSIDSEIEKIQGLMNSTDKVERNKYWSDDKMQARYVQLTQAKASR